MKYLNIDSIFESEYLDGILMLHESTFKDSSDLVKKMQNKSNLLITAAIEKSNIVGYKIGYELDSDKFYSWLGCVEASYRNQGVASNLMANQHEYLIKMGYKVVQTKTKNKWRNMLILNLKNGFDVIGTYTDQTGEPKIILEKKLIHNN